MEYQLTIFKFLHEFANVLDLGLNGYVIIEENINWSLLLIVVVSVEALDEENK